MSSLQSSAVAGTGTPGVDFKYMMHCVPVPPELIVPHKAVKRKLCAFTSLRFISPACVPFPLPTLFVSSLHFHHRFIVLCPVFIMARRLLSAHTLSSLLSDIKISHARQYTAATAEAMRSSGAAGREFPEVSKAGRGGGNNKGMVFWMRDPATGNWIPEDHFGETDIVELRQKLLSSRK